MPYSFHRLSARLFFALLSSAALVVAILVGSGVAVGATRCKHLSPQKMAACQQLHTVDKKQNVKKSKPNSKPGFDGKDLLWLLL